MKPQPHANPAPTLSSGSATSLHALVARIIRITLFAAWLGVGASSLSAADFKDRYFEGEGDPESLRLLDISRRMFAPDPEYLSLPMLYQPSWNGLVEGPTWGAWWIQNSYGTTYCGLPFYEEPLFTFLKHAQQLWFDKLGDGKTSYVWNGKDSWVPPDGCLMDCANETWAMHRQGDGRVAMHDWAVEFTAAGGLLQSELLLISRNRADLAQYLPKLERCANFIETRRDPTNNLFWAGPAANLLAPSYAGWKKPDGTYGMAYLAGLSVTYIAFLDRLVELEKLAANPALETRYRQRRETARAGLARLDDGEGCFVKSIDPDGTQHGVYGAAHFGYFETSPNHDAIAFRVVDDAQSRRIYDKIASIPGLRPHHLILPNAPSLDDMYEAPTGLWSNGTWVNGGHWTTCEARMLLAYFRLGKYADAFASMRQIMTFARRFRMDNPLVQFGDEVYQPNEPINVTYDAFGAPAGLLRGLFEYLYRADGLTLVPHLPTGLERLEQKFPVRFGDKRLYLAAAGQGPIREVWLNGKPWKQFEAGSVFLPYASLPRAAAIQVLMGTAKAKPFRAPPVDRETPTLPKLAYEWPKTAVISTNPLPVRLGADSAGGSRFRGDLAQAAIFNRALSQAEISALETAPPKDSSLVGYWDFADETKGGFVSRAKGELPAKKIGAVTAVEGPVGKAIRLNGEGYLELAPVPALSLTKGGTWFALIRPETTAGRLIDKCPVGGSAGYTFDLYPGNALRLITDAGTVSFAAKLPPGQWARVAATVDARGHSVLYLNGQKVAESTRTDAASEDLAALTRRVERLRRFHRLMVQSGSPEAYETAHARLVIDSFTATCRRFDRLRAGKLEPLPAASQTAADRLYLSTTAKLTTGLEQVLERYRTSTDSTQQRDYGLWQKSAH
jgi:hypothetical protein